MSAKPSIRPSEIRALRKSLDETQWDFARRIGVSQSTVARWEHGELLLAGPSRILVERLIVENEIARRTAQR